MAVQHSFSITHTLETLAELVGAPAPVLPERLSDLMAPFVPHDGMVILAADADGGARFDTGNQRITDSIPFLLLDQIRREGHPGTAETHSVEANGSSVSALVLLSRNGALLLFTQPSDGIAGSPSEDTAGPPVNSAVSTALHLWNIVALKVQEPADSAPPSYLQQARVSSGVRMEALTELADEYSTTLESALAALRSESLDDRNARQTATHIAAKGLVQLRTASDRVRTVTEEPVTTAFARLREDLRPLTRYRPIDVQFVEPPVDGRALPSEVAHGARAVVRSLILALVDRPSVNRIRIQWDCDGTNLIIDMRDDGPGDLTDSSLSLHLVRRRTHALYGRVDLHATPGWGTEIAVVIPLDPPARQTAASQSWNLSAREQEVLELVASGLRNREIAARLKISENTVKFHLARTYRKQGTNSRAEATALYLTFAAPTDG